MTEADAQSKWCPFARTQIVQDENLCAVVNRTPLGKPDSGAMCLASGCMAWRKVGVLVDRATGRPLLPGQTYQAGAAEERYLGDGYCGLAGAPS